MQRLADVGRGAGFFFLAALDEKDLEFFAIVTKYYAIRCDCRMRILINILTFLCHNVRFCAKITQNLEV